MIRRTLFSWLSQGISASFLAGAAGGISLGSAGAAAGIAATRPWTRESHSQQGEDLVIQNICDWLGITNPSYLDVGAADPIQDNNTYLFYQKGCRGVLVEPNPRFCRRLEARRPGDKVLNIGVGVSDQSEADYYMISGRDGEYLNTFSKKQVVDIVARAGSFRVVEKTIKMPLVNINRIMEQQFHGAPSLLCIDTEGLDLDILRTLDFTRFRPAVVCVETLKIGTTVCDTQIVELMQKHDYAVRGSTFVNTIFVDNQRLASLAGSPAGADGARSGS